MDEEQFCAGGKKGFGTKEIRRNTLSNNIDFGDQKIDNAI